MIPLKDPGTGEAKPRPGRQLVVDLLLKVMMTGKGFTPSQVQRSCSLQFYAFRCLQVILVVFVLFVSCHVWPAVLAVYWQQQGRTSKNERVLCQPAKVLESVKKKKCQTIFLKVTVSITRGFPIKWMHFLQFSWQTKKRSYLLKNQSEMFFFEQGRLACAISAYPFFKVRAH